MSEHSPSPVPSGADDSSHAPVELGGSVWLRAGHETLGGAARIALLSAIRDTGSITAAAKAVVAADAGTTSAPAADAGVKK